MRLPLLFLAHRIPYPPNKGDKIRSFHILKHLQERYGIRLGAFIDSEDDLAHVDALRDYCDDVHVERLRPRWAKLASLRGLMTGEPLTVPYYRCASMRRWIDAQIGRHGIRHALVYSSGPASYLLGRRYRTLRRVIDFVDVDSDKWAQYARTVGPLTRWVYRREAVRLLDFERRVAAEFDASVLVSAHEAELFRKLSPGSADKVWHANNGVDSVYFDPALPFENPYPRGDETIVFTGAMDYWPNVDAVCWFAQEVMPRIRARRPRAVFCIVGGNPTDRVRRLGDDPAVRVVGRVADVRPFLRHADAVVAPLRIARGIQNKVLEGMAMERPTVVTSPALEGIAARVGSEVFLGDTADDLAVRTVEAIGGGDGAVGRAARQRVLADFDWDRSLRRFDDLLEGKVQ
jgi:sugar transferase (PEP-CTERM/EpsH1 system associated)